MLSPERTAVVGPSVERPVWGEQECRKIAQDLYARHSEEIEQVRMTFHDGNTPLEAELREVPTEVQKHYFGHGVTKGDTIGKIAAVISILQNGAMRGGAAALEGGQPSAYTNGNFFVISHKGQELVERDADKKPIFLSLGENEFTGTEIKAVKIRSGAVIVNGLFYSLVDDLKKMYPEATIISAYEVKDYIAREERG